MNKRRVGGAYEDLACDFLKRHGVEIVSRNFTVYRTGELDIVGLQEGVLVFFEVKYRKDTNLGSPEEAVGPRKQRTICQLSDFYRMKNRNVAHLPIRFDVIAVTRERIRWIPNAFPYHK